MSVAAVLLLAAAPAPRQEAAGGAVGQSARVVVPLVAADKEGRPLEDLRPEDLRVTLEGAEQKVVSLARAGEEPLRVAFMLDASASQERVLPYARAAVEQFVSTSLRAGADEAAVISFADGAKVVQPLTGDAAALRRAVASVRFVAPPGYVRGGVVVGRPPRGAAANGPGSTALWDSLASACEQVFAGAAGGRRVVVLVTDGVDTGSRSRSDAAVERLLLAGVAVYSVGVADPGWFDPVDRGALRKVSERTGGRALFPKNEEYVGQSFERLARELRSAYTLGLAPPAPGGAGTPQRLRVEIVNPELRRRGVELAYPHVLAAGAQPPAPR